MVACITYECGECGKLEHDELEFRKHWFQVEIPRDDIERIEGITFCMPTAEFCSLECFSAFGDRLVRIKYIGTDRLGVT